MGLILWILTHQKERVAKIGLFIGWVLTDSDDLILRIRLLVLCWQIACALDVVTRLDRDGSKTGENVSKFRRTSLVFGAWILTPLEICLLLILVTRKKIQVEFVRILSFTSLMKASSSPTSQSKLLQSQIICLLHHILGLGYIIGGSHCLGNMLTARHSSLSTKQIVFRGRLDLLAIRKKWSPLILGCRLALLRSKSGLVCV